MKIALIIIILGLIVVLYFALIILISVGVYTGLKQFFDESGTKKEQKTIDKMKCCENCKHYCINDEDEFDCCRSYNCTKFGKWELAE